MKLAVMAWIALLLGGCGDPVFFLSVRNRSDSTYLVEYRLEGVAGATVVRADAGVNAPIAESMGNYDVHVRVFDAACQLVAEHRARIGGLVVDIQPDGTVRWRSPGDFGPEDPVGSATLPLAEACAG